MWSNGQYHLNPELVEETHKFNGELGTELQRAILKPSAHYRPLHRFFSVAFQAEGKHSRLYSYDTFENFVFDKVYWLPRLISTHELEQFAVLVVLF